MNRKIYYNLLTIGALSALFWPASAHAYLDPGTGSYIIQIILAAILGGLFAFRMFFVKIFHSIKNIFRRTPNKKPDEKKEQ